MSKDWVFKRHIRINEENVIRRLKKTRPPPRFGGSKKEHKQFGDTLTRQIDAAADYCRRPNKVIEEDYLFVVRTVKKINFEDKALDRLGLKVSLQTDDYSAIVGLNQQTLQNLRSIVKTYMIDNELRSCVNEIESFAPVNFERADPEISDWIRTSQGDITNIVEIEFLPNLGEETYTSIMNQLSDFFSKEELEASFPSRIREDSASLRAKLTPQTARKVKDGIDAIWQTRKSPRIVFGTPKKVVDEQEIIAALPEPIAVPICVLDSGIDLQHPLVKDIIINAVDLTGDHDETDRNDHGTFVAGLAAYGDIENKNEIVPSALIISAKIIGKDRVISPYLETRLEDAVARFHQDTKIFSLSVMYLEQCSYKDVSELAATIDKLSHKYDVLFVVCTGNLEEEPKKLKLMPYPAYFGHGDCILYKGAEAANCVTVGGIANKDSKSCAKVREPSPFTRRGEIQKRSKPDVVYWAGNSERALTGELVDSPNLGLLSLGLSGSSLLEYDYGTSCAAPLVANFIAKIYSEYPNATANLLKALLIHFSTVPEEKNRLNIGDSLKSALYGQGLPDFYKAAYSTKSCATMVFEGSIAPNEILRVPIYIPKVMKTIYGEKVLRVTLVYNPPTDRGTFGYILLDMSFKLFKVSQKGSKPQVQNHWDKISRIRWDTVKKDTFRWQKTGWGQEWFIELSSRVRSKKKIAELGEASQKFALVITLEDPKGKVDIYNAISNERRPIEQTLQAYIQTKRKS